MTEEYGVGDEDTKGGGGGVGGVFFLFQAEDGIRDRLVTGVQTCALPIFRALRTPFDSRDIVITRPRQINMTMPS